jgi:hypothetical protein
MSNIDSAIAVDAHELSGLFADSFVALQRDKSNFFNSLLVLLRHNMGGKCCGRAARTSLEGSAHGGD